MKPSQLAAQRAIRATVWTASLVMGTLLAGALWIIFKAFPEEHLSSIPSFFWWGFAIGWLACIFMGFPGIYHFKLQEAILDQKESDHGM